MGQFRDDAGENRFAQDFDTETGGGQVWADYAVRGGARVIYYYHSERLPVFLLATMVVQHLALQQFLF